MTRLVAGWTVLPLRTAATRMRSVYEELVQLPMAICAKGSGPASETLRTASGECAQATKGSKESRSTVMVLAYDASGSGARCCHAVSLFWTFNKILVCSSHGQREVVA